MIAGGQQDNGLTAILGNARGFITPTYQFEICIKAGGLQVHQHQGDLSVHDLLNKADSRPH